MRALAIHDHHGNLTALVVGPADEKAPTAGVSLPGHVASAVEVPDLPHDLEQEASQRKVLDLLRESRVDVARPTRLVPRSG